MTLSTISVADMHCGSCVGKIERALAGFAGITATYVNAARRQVLVEHGSDTDPVELLQRIEEAGFHPSLERIEAGSAAQREMLKRLGIAGLAMMQVMMFAIAMYAGVFTGMDEADKRLLEFASLAFCIPVVSYSAMPFFVSALKALRTGLNMDVPIALAIFSAFTVSLANTLTGNGEVYYDSVVMFTFLLLTARYVDDRLKARFEDTNWTLSTLPERALVVGDDGSLTPIPLGAIVPGTRIWVEQGNQLPLDGDVAVGTAVLDESALTGESVLVHRGPGERVFAGTMNRGPGFALVTTALVDATRIAGIAELASRAQADKPPVAKLADRIARYFVPGVLLLSAVSFIGWQFVDPSQAFVAALTVLVVSCPCALSLATPATLTAAMTWLRQNGIVLTRSEPLEQMARIDAAIIDKTGTLTVHDPVLTRVDLLQPHEFGRDQLVQIAATLERHANHPLARAFRTALGDSSPTSVEDVQVIAGAGVQGRYRGRLIRVGHARFCGSSEADEHAVFMAVDGITVARFIISDAVRADAAAAVNGLKRAGIQVTMVSGDAPERCAELARELDIDFAARQAPETKLEITRELQRQGRRVLVLGDGINDVPALAAADVSAAVLESSDLVKANADVLLLSRRLGALADLVEVSRRTRRIVRQNMGWALSYNMTAMPLAALGFMPPWLAAIGMAGSSILVMSNATRLLRHDTVTKPPADEAAAYTAIQAPAR
ncbi:MAG: heavy metal translocating P-type ATPase [Pseudomonadales bacterium]